MHCSRFRSPLTGEGPKGTSHANHSEPPQPRAANRRRHCSRLVAFADSARADIFQWEYINPADPSQGKRQSTTLAPDGAGVDAVPGADLSYRDLTMAYLSGADLTGVMHIPTNLTDATLSPGEPREGEVLRERLPRRDFSDAVVWGADLSIYNDPISFTRWLESSSRRKSS